MAELHPNYVLQDNKCVINVVTVLTLQWQLTLSTEKVARRFGGWPCLNNQVRGNSVVTHFIMLKPKTVSGYYPGKRFESPDEISAHRYALSTFKIERRKR
jgi:hypothetical protein